VDGFFLALFFALRSLRSLFILHRRRYQHSTPFKTELLDYREILEFVLEAHTVFMRREGAENETVKQRS